MAPYWSYFIREMHAVSSPPAMTSCKTAYAFTNKGEITATYPGRQPGVFLRDYRALHKPSKRDRRHSHSPKYESAYASDRVFMTITLTGSHGSILEPLDAISKFEKNQSDQERGDSYDSVDRSLAKKAHEPGSGRKEGTSSPILDHRLS